MLRKTNKKLKKSRIFVSRTSKVRQNRQQKEITQRSNLNSKSIGFYCVQYFYNTIRYCEETLLERLVWNSLQRRAHKPYDQLCTVTLCLLEMRYKSVGLIKERLVVIVISTIQCVSFLGCNARKVVHNRKRQQDCCQKV